MLSGYAVFAIGICGYVERCDLVETFELGYWKGVQYLLVSHQMRACYFQCRGLASILSAKGALIQLHNIHTASVKYGRFFSG